MRRYREGKVLLKARVGGFNGDALFMAKDGEMLAENDREFRGWSWRMRF